MIKYCLPKKTAELLNQLQLPQQSQTLTLLLNKYVRADAIDKEEAEDKRKDERNNWLREIAQNYRSDPQLASAAYQRWCSYTSDLGATHFSAEVDWRMIVGFGGNSVLETDLTLHHLYSLPIIPGSALKGLARTYAAMEDETVYIGLENQRMPSKKIETDHDNIKRIFGTEDQAGTVIFFDAFPKDGHATFVLDIMNPHYPNYYQRNAVPSNNQDPIPIGFLAVEHPTTYMFALALRQGAAKKADLDAANRWLREALRSYGIGGKTSAGYGYFKKEGTTELKKAQGTTTERIRVKLPQLRAGQEIKGSVVPLTDELRARMPSDIKAILRYESFSTREVLIAINAKEVENWKPGETRICIFEREEVHDSLTIWFCKPRVKKDKRK